METGWRKFNSTKDTEIYFYNIFTGSQSWEKDVHIDREEDDVKGWEKVMSKKYNQEYWFNESTGESTWEYPLKPCRKLIKYNTIPNDGGGDCLFKSFRDIREFYVQKPSYTHQELRQMSCNWLESDDWDMDAVNGTEQRARADVIESLRFALFPPEGIPVTLPEARRAIQDTRKAFNKKYNLPIDKNIDTNSFIMEDQTRDILGSLKNKETKKMTKTKLEIHKKELKIAKINYEKALINSTIALRELQKRYAYALSREGEYGNTPDITALSWVLGVKTCVYKDDPENSTGSNFGPYYRSGPTYYIINYGSAHFEGMKNVEEDE